MVIDPRHGYIVSTPKVCGGSPRIDGHRIRVQDIAVAHESRGLNAEGILKDFPSLNLAKVYAALAFFYDHRDEILAEIAADEKFIEEFQRQHPEWALGD